MTLQVPDRSFSQIMALAGEAGFLGSTEGGGEGRRELGDVAEVGGQGLPLAGGFRQRIAIRVFGRVRVKGHGAFGVFQFITIRNILVNGSLGAPFPSLPPVE